MLKIAMKLMVSKRNKIPKKGEYVSFNNYERKIKSSFMTYADFEKVLLVVMAIS